MVSPNASNFSKHVLALARIQDHYSQNSLQRIYSILTIWSTAITAIKQIESGTIEIYAQ